MNIESILQAVKNQKSFTVPSNMYKNELLNILQLKNDDYIVVVNDEVADMGIIIKPGDEVTILPVKIGREKKYEKYFLDYFEEYYSFQTIEDLNTLIQGYFGEDISLGELNGIIDIYQRNSIDLSVLMDKVDFFNEIGGLLSSNYDEMKRGDGFKKAFVNEFIGMGISWYKSHRSQDTRTSVYRKVYYTLKSKIDDVGFFQKCSDIIDRAKSSLITQSKQVDFTRVIESIQDLYSEYIPSDRRSFTTQDFSSLLYGIAKNQYLSTRKGQVSLSNEVRDAASISLSTYIKMEQAITRLELEETDIKTIENLKKFRDQALALLRWHYLQTGLVSTSAMREASILLRIASLTQTSNTESIDPNQYAHFRGFNKFSITSLNNIEKKFRGQSPSAEKKYISDLIKVYKERWIADSLRSLEIGNIFHVHGEDISGLRFLEGDVTFKNERLANYPHTLHRIDTWIKVNNKLRNIVNQETLSSINKDHQFKILIDEIREISIDFTTLGGDNQHILDKLNKYYQRKERPLFIVIYGEHSSNQINKLKKEIEINPKGKNCRLITIDQYLELFSFSGKYKSYMKILSDLAFASLNDKEQFQRLQEFDIHNTNLLKQYQKSITDSY